MAKAKTAVSVKPTSEVSAIQSPTPTLPSGIGSTDPGASIGSVASGLAASVPSGSTPLGTTSAPQGFQLQVLQMLQGVQTVLPVGSAVSTASGSLTQSAMVSQLQAMMSTYQAVSDDVVTLKQSRQQLKTQLPGYEAAYAQMKAAIIAFFGATSPQLAKFGMKAKTKAKPLTTAQKMVREARAKQTRVLRGTLGKKAKAAIQYSGQITVTAVSAPTASASSAAASVPAATPSAAVAVPAVAPAVTPIPDVSVVAAPKSA